MNRAGHKMVDGGEKTLIEGKNKDMQNEKSHRTREKQVHLSS